MNYALKDAQVAMRTPLAADPTVDEEMAACRRVLVSHGAHDLIGMVVGAIDE
jgi:hypothetical protein